MTVDIVDAALHDGDRSSVVTFEFSEAVAAFDVSDVTVTGGLLSGLMAVDADSFSAVFTAFDSFDGAGSVSVGSGYADVAGNAGQGDSDGVVIDTLNPSVAISFVTDPISKATFSSVVTFQFSDAVVGFSAADISVAGGSLTNLVPVAADRYTALLQVADDVEVTGSVSVRSGYNDLVGNAGSPASETVVIDTLAPTVAVNIVESVLSDVNTSLVTFTFSEAVDFDLSDVTVVGGSLSSFSLTGPNTFTATMTADDDLVGTASVTVKPTYADLAGNSGSGDADTAATATTTSEATTASTRSSAAPATTTPHRETILPTSPPSSTKLSFLTHFQAGLIRCDGELSALTQAVVAESLSQDEFVAQMS